eukprot:157895_1
MSSTRSCVAFKQLKNIEDGGGSMKKAFALNSNEIVVLYEDEIWKYKNNQDEWLKIMDIYGTIGNRLRFSCSSLNKETATIYALNNGQHPRYMNIIDLNTQNITESPQDDCFGYVSLCVDNKLHVFGTMMRKPHLSHFISNGEVKEIKQICSLDEFDEEHLRQWPVIYLSSKKSVLFGQDLHRKLYLYSLSTNDCAEIIATSQDDMHAYASKAVLTTDERYIIHFWESNFHEPHPVYVDVLDLKLNKWIATGLQAPVTQTFDPIKSICLLHDEGREGLSTSGFVRGCWKKSEFESLMYPPFYLIKIIETYVVFATIHLFYFRGNHCKIDVNDIFENLNL